MTVQDAGKKMTTREIETTLQNGLGAILSAEPSSLGIDQPFHELGVDSLGLVEILVYIEKTFKLQLIQSDLTRKDFETIQSLASFIHKTL